MKRWQQAVLAVAVAVLTPVANAHTFGAYGAGFAAGAAHPFTGLDHLAAMVAVGLWAAQLGGNAVLRVPAAFVATMGVGAAAAVFGVSLPGVEAGIGASVLVLGLLIAFATRLPTAAGMLLVGAFAVFHGHAHGSELPGTALPWLYAAGFMLATGALHAVGVCAGRALRRRTVWLVRANGAALAAGGIVLLMT